MRPNRPFSEWAQTCMERAANSPETYPHNLKIWLKNDQLFLTQRESGTVLHWVQLHLEMKPLRQTHNQFFGCELFNCFCKKKLKVLWHCSSWIVYWLLVCWWLVVGIISSTGVSVTSLFPLHTTDSTLWRASPPLENMYVLSVKSTDCHNHTYLSHSANSSSPLLKHFTKAMENVD